MRSHLDVGWGSQGCRTAAAIATVVGVTADAVAATAASTCSALAAVATTAAAAAAAATAACFAFNFALVSSPSSREHNLSSTGLSLAGTFSA